MLRLTFPIYLLLILSIFSTCRFTSEKKYYTEGYPARRVYVGRGYAGSPVNTSIGRQHAIYNYNNHQYLAYYDPDGQIVFSRRNHNNENWESFFTKLYGSLDRDQFLSFAFDKVGYIHLCYTSKDDSLHYYRSTLPEDPYKFESRPILMDLNSKHISKPQFAGTTEHDLYMSCQYIRNNQNELCIIKYDEGNGNWEKLQNPLVKSRQSKMLSWSSLCIDSQKSLHLVWAWRFLRDEGENSLVCYAKSIDDGKTWKRSDNSEYVLPISEEKAQIIEKITGPGSEKKASLAMDSYNRPHIAYYKNDTNGIPQYIHRWWNGNKWLARQISQRKMPIDGKNEWEKVLTMSNPNIAISQDNTIYIIFRDSEKGDRIRISTSSKEPYDLWQEFDIYDSPLPTWEPIYDKQLWQLQHRLDLFFQFAYHFSQDQPVPEFEITRNSSVNILQWQP